MNAPYLQDFFDFLNIKVQVSSAAMGKKVKSAEIRFENVSYRYPGAENYALRNINITIAPGESLLIVGENGAGKSAFAKLLCGLIHPTEGRILLNGIDIAGLNKGEYMQNISAVFQDYRLFAVPIGENVAAMGNRDNERIKNALERVNLYNKISNFQTASILFMDGNLIKTGLSYPVAKRSA